MINQANSLWVEGKYDKAIILYENILEEDPKQIHLYENLIKAYAYLGMFDMAKKRAKELYGRDSEDPMMIGGEKCRLALIYTMQNQSDEALRAVNKMVEVMDSRMIFPGAPTCAMFFQTKAGEHEKAAANLDKILQVKDAGLMKYVFLLYAAYVNEKLGNIEKSEKLMASLKEGIDFLRNSGTLEQLTNQPGAAHIYMILADYHAYRGEEEKALEYLKKHYSVGGRQYYWIEHVSPFLTTIKDNPQYVSILNTMKEDIEKMRGNVEARQF